jgi:uncharacterized protein YegP (UPF0339 family)
MKTVSIQAVALVSLTTLLAMDLQVAGGQEPKTPPLRFVVLKEANTEYRWRLQDREGVVLAVSERTIPAKQAVRDAIEEVRKSAASDKVKYEVYQDAKMIYRWRLKGDEGRVLAVSGDQGYQDAAAAEKAIAAVKAGAREAEVVDKTD